MNYEQCLRYLEEIQNLGIKFGLDNVRTLLAAFDNPHKKYASLLVAGTNGKGSVCAMLSEIMSRHDFRVGLFTSPHLIMVEERIRIGKALIPTQSFCRILTLLRKKIEELIKQKKLLSPPTYFELLTCLALIYFKRQKVDMAVLEVGMGGRFDATNVVNPVLSVITTISKEHQKFLGASLGQIAFEKAGIIKPDVPVICGVKATEAYEAIKKRAEELRVPFLGVFDRKNSFQVQKTERDYSFVFRTQNSEYRFSPSLQGEHQGKNAAMAIAAAEQLSKNWKELEEDKIVEGIERTRWEGRLEVISQAPLVVLDGAHNEEGAYALSKYIKDFLPSPLILVFAIMRDKEVKNIADILFPLAGKVILTRFPYFRASSPDEIKEKTSNYLDRVVLEPDVNRAIDLAFRSVASEGSILIAGSLYLVGEAKKYFNKKE